MIRAIMSRRSPIFLGPIQSTPFHRYIAKLIDVILVLVIFFVSKAVWSPLGPLLGCFFAAFQDSLGDGQSIGKKIIGLRTIDESAGTSCSALGSAMRNLPLALVILFASVPILSVLVLFAATPFIILEIYLVFSLDTGVRLGDVMANTLIVEHLEIHPESTRFEP